MSGWRDPWQVEEGMADQVATIMVEEVVDTMMMLVLATEEAGAPVWVVGEGEQGEQWSWSTV